MNKILKLIFFFTLVLTYSSCTSFQAKRVSAEESDEKAMLITDEWVAQDTKIVVDAILKKIDLHKGFKNYLRDHKKTPTLFVADVQNLTSEAYFPVSDITDELLERLSASGDFILVDAAARDRILQEITYQNDGMVDPNTAKRIGKQVGADLMIFGNIYMQPQMREGKTIKEYAVNIRLTDIEKATEVLRVRERLNKFSDQKSRGW